MQNGFYLSGRQDLNLRPHAPQTCALPGCATSRTKQLPTDYRLLIMDHGPWTMVISNGLQI